jgi:hypothetical protein
MRSLLVAVLFSAACIVSSDKSAASEFAFPFGHPDTSVFLPGPRMSILGVTIGVTDAVVRSALGPPEDSTVPQDVRDSVFDWHYRDIQVSFDGHRLYNLQCLAPRCVTAAGVRTGSPRADVLRAYGPGFRGFHSWNDVLIYYSRSRQWRMVFIFTAGRVTRMYLECDWPPAWSRP